MQEHIESASVIELPKLELGYMLALCKAKCRYHSKLDSRLSLENGSGWITAILEHNLKLIRLAEGFSAFATTGCDLELMWLSRPVVEILFSQCILQYGNVFDRTLRRHLDNEEKADRYYLHSRVVLRRVLESALKSEMFSESKVTICENLRQMQDELSSVTISLSERNSWHGYNLVNAFEQSNKICESRDYLIGKLIRDIWPTAILYMHNGIHAGQLVSNGLRKPISDSVIALEDERIFPNATFLNLIIMCAHTSLEMVADLYGERPLMQAMIESAHSEIQERGSGFVPAFISVKSEYSEP